MFTLTCSCLAGSPSYSAHYVEAVSLDALYFASGVVIAMLLNM